eukprot:TRINITY_DN14508_c0_g1_i1.p1 TRINITY_DN14508_c0_g1~~TRINITY_DN14508_c0_g1_i1.p1  ORF type:complete len:513 (+),score=92.89 TRINITY_DN14508_c0_g1_i1:261-1799(+)
MVRATTPTTMHTDKVRTTPAPLEEKLAMHAWTDKLLLQRQQRQQQHHQHHQQIQQLHQHQPHLWKQKLRDLQKREGVTQSRLGPAATAAPQTQFRGGTLRSSHKALKEAVSRLCKALSDATVSQRRTVISGLSEGLRRELICVREAQQRGMLSNASEGLLPKAELPQIPSLQAHPSAAASQTQMHLEGSRKSEDVPLPSANATMQSCSGIRGNVWCVKTASGCYFKVRISIGGVAVTSRRLKRRGTADSVLALLRRAAEDAASRGGKCEDMLRALAAAGSSARNVDGLADSEGDQEDLGLSFQAILDARRCIGHRLHTQTVDCIEEAIKLRREVLEAQASGFVAISRAWMQLSQEPRHKKGRVWKVSQAKAEQFCALAEQRILSKEQARSARQNARRLQQLKRQRVHESRLLKRKEHVAKIHLRGLKHLAQSAEAALKHVWMTLKASRPQQARTSDSRTTSGDLRQALKVQRCSLSSEQPKQNVSTTLQVQQGVTWPKWQGSLVSPSTCSHG